MGKNKCTRIWRFKRGNVVFSLTERSKRHLTSMALKVLAASRAGGDAGREQLPAACPGAGAGEHHRSDARRRATWGAWQASWRETFLAVTLSGLIDFPRSLHFLWSGIFQWKTVWRRFLASLISVPLGFCFIPGLFQYLMSDQFLHRLQMFGIKFAHKHPPPPQDARFIIPSSS